MGAFGQDLRFGARRLAKSPGFALIAIVSLALGIGVNTAIFSLVNAVVLRPLPVARADEVVSVAVRGQQDAMLAFSYPNYRDFRDRNQVLSGLAVERFVTLSLSHRGENERLWGYLVSGNYFDVLGVRAGLGRTFAPEEDRTPLAHPVAVVSHACWLRRFGGDAGLVGREIQLNGHAFTVIGVAPEGFRGTEIIYTPEIWIPTMMLAWVEPGADWLERRRTQNLFAIGRLKPGVGIEQAESSLNLLGAQLAREFPDENEGQSIRLFRPGLILPDLQGAVAGFSWALLGAVALVLVIACTNLASLLLVRATERRREVAVRLALGASRWRLIRQLLTENLLLALAGGAAGVLVAAWILRAAAAVKPPVDFPLTIDLVLDGRVLAFALAASLATSVVFGLAPALQASRPDLVGGLKDASSQAGRARSRLRSGLVVAQLALSLVFLIAAGLVLRTLGKAQSLDPGFDPAGRLMMSVDLGLQGYDAARGQQFYRDAVAGIGALPGVRSAAVTNFVPLSLNYTANEIHAEGRPAARGANVPSAMTGSAGAGYFATMGVGLVAGREFEEHDGTDAEPVAIANLEFVRRIFPEAASPQAALGRRFSFSGADGPWVRLVGIVRDGKYFYIGEQPRPFVCTPMAQGGGLNASLIVRVAGEPAAMIPAVRARLEALDPSLPIYDVKTLGQHLGLALFPARVAAAVLGGFGLLALTLAAVGIYGVTSYSVAQRTREIGIRMALGALRGDVSRLVLAQGLLLAASGLGLGLLLALAATRWLRGLLFAVSPTDPLTFALVPLVLGAVALAACWLPARRASRVDPAVALRAE
ncbi:MAG TPA: ABC transporter permease [Candidatus Polarisedimenticolaceae bacterium]|nr:ABC transporter permease [Candidatus Polarisedimenticolaceae bacterium]